MLYLSKFSGDFVNLFTVPEIIVKRKRQIKIILEQMEKKKLTNTSAKSFENFRKCNLQNCRQYGL